MTHPPPSPLAERTVLNLLEQIAPGSALLHFELLPGSLSNYTHLVEARRPEGDDFKLVLRRYAVFGGYDRAEKARREFKTLELVSQHGIPVPQPLLLDKSGAVLGSPGIVTGFVPGSLVADIPSDWRGWAQRLAVMLARIHAVPCGDDARRFLLDANAEASWVVRAESAPGYMQSFPGGVELWQALRELYPGIRAVLPSLVHIDYWSGNILWQGDEISAVLDWEEAAYGDPAIDVAYARMHMALEGSEVAADEFLAAYEVEAGGRVEDLGFWELAAAVRPMFDAPGWQVTESPRRDRLQRFIAVAYKRAA
jgi:aminoglycoside phosphotransferase (APT) family kinase protein